MIKKLVLVFNINNLQSHYALCMDFIQSIEEKHNIDEYLNESFKGKFIANVLKRVRITLDDTMSQIYDIDSIKKSEEKLRKPSEPIDMYGLCDFVKKNTTYEFYYYFRVSNPIETDIAEVFYYVLMLQANYMPSARIAVCYLSDFESDYYRFSHFLQRLPANNKNFHISIKNGIKKLDDTNISTHLFPIIEINEKSYAELTSARKLIYDLDGVIIRKKDAPELEKAIASILPDTTCELEKFIFLYANNFITYGKGNTIKSKDKIDAITKAIIDFSEAELGITALHYLVFSIMLSPLFVEFSKSTAHDVKSLVNSCLIESIVFTDAIAQILENIVHHSDMKKGLLAMRLHDYNEQLDYLEQLNNEFKFGEDKAGTKTRYLQVLIGDINQNSSIKNKFLENYSKETAALSSSKDAISLKDFFGEWKKGQAIKRWDEFRNSHPAKCEGLLKFNYAMKAINAVVLVRSSATIINVDDKDIWNRDFRAGDSIEALSDIANYIPGTQYNFIVPILHKKSGSDQTFMLSEDFGSYAQALEINDCSIKKIDTAVFLKKLEEIEEECKRKYSSSTITQSRKDYYWKAAQTLWDEALEDKSNCLLVDMNSFCVWATFERRLWIEPFCKGFLTSKQVVILRNKDETLKRSLYLKFENCNENFIQAFRTTASVNPYNLEKSGIQIRIEYKHEENKKPIFVGESYEITRSGLKYNYLEDKNEDNATSVSPPALPSLFPWAIFETKKIGENIINKLNKAAKGELAPELPIKITGYCLNNSHIKLGGKVHIDKFYEMAPYLLRQDVAKEVAFWLLRKLIFEDTDFIKLLEDGKVICLYGYASYSRAIVNAMYEILQRYISKNNYKDASVSFVIYQPQQAGESVDNEEEVYLCNEVLKEKEADRLAIIQVVPISSTLTTFKKLWDILKESSKFNELPDAPAKNLTVLWVRGEDEPKGSDDNRWIANDYWESAENNVITISSGKSAIIKKAIYVTEATSKWQIPIKCELCYPSELGLEFPLVSTDETSTIPTQQYYSASKNSEKRDDTPSNAQRIAQLYGFLKYGHISRASNHFQYYIDMQRYFRANKKDIGIWLDNIGKNLRGAIKEALYSYAYIISPQKPNNIEFSQYVNNQCFLGKAKVLYLDSEKHFRSNVEAEYGSYMADSNMNNSMFIYVDTSIDTGQTFQRISTLVSSIVPCGTFEFSHVILLVNRLSTTSQKSYVRGKSNFYAYVNLDVSNIRTYGDSCIGCKMKNRAEKYYEGSATKTMSEYWELKAIKSNVVSHVRWENLNSEKFRVKNNRGFMRMLCTHNINSELSDVRGKEPKYYSDKLEGILRKALEISVAQEKWSVDEESSSVFDHKFAAKYEYNYETIYEVQHDAKEKVIISYIKVLSRPFFSYDYKLKCCVADILMFLVMLVLEDFNDETALRKLADVKMGKRIWDRKPLFSPSRKKWRCEFAKDIRELIETDCSESKLEKSDFLLILFKALADMHMNFIYRKDIISGVNRFFVKQKATIGDFEEFYKHYTRYIMYVVKSGEDESRGLLLEYLLRNGSEYPVITNSEDENMRENLGLRSDNEKLARTFDTAAKLLFVENNSALLKGVQEIYSRSLITTQSKDKQKSEVTLKLDKNFLYEAHMSSFCSFLAFEQSHGKKVFDRSKQAADEIISNGCYDANGWVYENAHLYKCLVEDNKGGQSDTGNKNRYSDMQEYLSKVANVYFSGCILTLAAQQDESRKSDYLPYEKYYSIVEPENKDIIKPFKKHLEEKNTLENEKLQRELDNLSFYIASRNDKDKGKIFIKLENNHKSKAEFLDNPNHKSFEASFVQKMQPVYVLIEHEKICRDDYKTMTLIRNILMYRHYLISWFEKDFNNDAMASVAWISHTAGLLVAEKAGDHSNKNDVDFLQFHLSRQPWPDEWPPAKKASQIDSEFLQQNKEVKGIEEKYVINSCNKAGHSDKTAWLLLNSYANMKIGRLYRTMVDCLSLGHHLRISDIYRTQEQGKKNNRGPLLTLTDAFSGTIGEYKIRNKTNTYDIYGLSRKHSLILLMKAIEIIVHIDKKEVPINRPDDLYSIKDFYKFIEFEIGDNKYRYCSEFFFCIFLDFCYSAIKHGYNWNEGEYASYNGGISEQFQYFKHHANKCKVNIRCENGGEVAIKCKGSDVTHTRKKYDYLILESNINTQRYSNEDDKKPGMSEPSMRWYFDGLWNEYCKSYGEDSLAIGIPSVVINPPDSPSNKYIVKIPIISVD